MGISMNDIRQLSVADRIRLVEEIWDSIAASQQDLPLSEPQRKELDRRLGEYAKEPEAGRPWDAVREDPGPPE